MTEKNEGNIENKVKNLIKKSLEKRLTGWDNIDPTLANFALIERWLTEIMALGNNDDNNEAAAKYIFELQGATKGESVYKRYLEDCRESVFLCYNRFTDEISAFQKYLELKDKESENVIIYAVEKELEFVESGSFMLNL